MKGLTVKTKKIIISSIILLLALCFGLSKDAICQKDELDTQKELRQEIQILNLINGLYLTYGQKEFIIQQAEKAEQIKQTLIDEHRERSFSSGEALKQLKQELIENKPEISESLAKQLHQTNKREQELIEEYKNKVKDVIQLVKSSLTDTQLHIIEEFKPCLIPPKGPARIGQAADYTKGVRQLEHIRDIPDEIYYMRKDMIAQRVIDRVLSHVPKTVQIDENEILDKLLATFDKARSLSNIDFELSKEELVKQLREDLQNIFPKIKTADIDTKIKHFLISPIASSILKETLTS